VRNDDYLAVSNSRQIALVLGMHRSGTSALASLISRLGFSLGKNLLPANEYNVKGYYENEKVVNFHSEALAHLGSSWHDLRILPDELFRASWIDDAVLRLSDILQDEFGDAAAIVVKDPRASRLLPIWHRFAQETGADLKFILIGRHPLEVCRSLSHRDGFSHRKSLLLWLQYNLVAERQTRSGKRLILRYRDLLMNPESKVSELSNFLEAQFPFSIAEAAGVIDSSIATQFVDNEGISDHPDVRRWTKEVWQILFRRNRLQPAARQKLDRIFKSFRQRLSILPEEANGTGDYEATRLKRVLSRTDEEHQKLREQYQEQSQSLQNVMEQREAARKEIKLAEDEHQKLRERYQEQSQALQIVMEQREAARKRIKLAEEQYQEQSNTLQRVIRERETARKQLKITEDSLYSFEEETGILKEMLEGTAAQITDREADWAKLQGELESLRHDWLALPVRKRIKKLAGTSLSRSSGLVRVNALTPSVWNRAIAGFHFGISVFADVSDPDRFSIDGWVIPDEKNSAKLPLRLVSESGLRSSAKRGLPRIDLPLLFENNPSAAQAGFVFLDLRGFAGERCRLEIRKSPGEWVPLALIDFNGIGLYHLRDIHEIVSSQLFDYAWYAKRYNLPRVSQPGLVSHYLREGAARGLFPNSLFDTAYYLQSNREICETGENPLLAYLRSNREGNLQQPNPWFEPAWYLAKNEDVPKTGLDPLAHYFKYGRHEKRNPGPDFDAEAYLRRNPDVERSNLDALSHFIHYGSLEGRGITRPGDFIKWVYEIDALPENKINVLLVGHALGEKMFGGERSLLELIQLIDRDRFNIFCCFPQTDVSFVERIKSSVAGVAVFPYQWWHGSAPSNDGFVRHFEEIMLSRRIGLVHVNSIVLRDPLIAAKQLGIPSILHLREVITRDPDLAERIGLPAEQIATEVAQYSDFIIANSHFTLTQQRKVENSFVLYNTADEVALDIPLRTRHDGLRVAMLSSNLPKKGLEDFFTIARRAREQDRPLEFWLVGPETDWVRQHFQSNGGCPSNVYCTGYVADPREVLSVVDVVINLSSFAESFGRSVCEGMLARRPAVVYDYGALPELIRDGIDGFVVRFRDADAALDRLNRLAGDQALFSHMAESARARALNNFSRAVGVEALNRIYQAILQTSASQPESVPGNPPAGERIAGAPAQRRMRIGYFLWHFPVPSETFVLNELRDFIRRGHDVLVFCKESPHKDFEPDFPVKWHRVKTPGDLATEIKESNREIMHSHFVYPTVTEFLWPACEAAGVPFTFIAHGQDIFRYENAEKNRLGEIARSPFCRNVFAPGSFHREFFIKSDVPEEKIIVSPQGILFEAYEPQPIAPRLESPRMSVCAIHRFVEKKGLHDAIRAAQRLEPLGISLYLYGYGPLEESYRQLVAELDLRNVFFPGAVRDRNHMIAVFREHDLFLCPAVRAENGDMDGIPTILVEAMASHVPVVASRISSIPDLVLDGVTGYLAEPGDVDSLTEAIFRFYRDPSARVQSIIENGREHVRNRFDVMRSNRTLLRTWSGEGLDVVLVTFNDTAAVQDVIERLYRFTKTPFQVYIVDNSSEQDTLDYVHSVEATHSNVRVLPQEENLFVGPGTNKGIEAGSSPFIFYLCSREGYVLSAGWDQRILDYMEDHPKVGLGGTLGYSPSYLIGADYPEKIEPFPRFRNPDFAAKNPERLFKHVQGGMFAIRRSMFESIGGFSEAVPHNHTDVEYSYYVESCGWQLGQIPDMVALYNKTRPELTARLTESVFAVHPGSPGLAPVFESITKLTSNFCNVCGSAVSFVENASANATCPICTSTPFERSLYRFLAESILTYRQLVALFVAQSDCLMSAWKKMFSGRTLRYRDLIDEIDAQGQASHPSERFDLIVLRVPDRTEGCYPAVFRECSRVLKPGGQLLYFQQYGNESILDCAQKKLPLSGPEPIASMLESHAFQVESRVRYASAAVCYSDCAIFVCRKPAQR
jgi:glycosyltransferase involved in cell wall biosynthesis